MAVMVASIHTLRNNYWRSGKATMAASTTRSGKESTLWRLCRITTIKRLLASLFILREVIRRPRLGQVFPGVNLSDRDDDWKQNFREPDVAVFLRDGKAINHGTHWQGAADFLVEIISPGERTRDKIPFYSGIGVVELLIS